MFYIEIFKARLTTTWLLVDFPSCVESILPSYGRAESLTIFLHRNSYEIAAPNSKRN